jgi:hypothetical protein
MWGIDGMRCRFTDPNSRFTGIQIIGFTPYERNALIPAQRATISA